MSKKAISCAVEIHARAGTAYVRYLRQQLQRVLQLADTPLRELSVVLVGDVRMSKLHDEFFGDPETTDVITFPLEVDAKGRASSGELYVCVPVARRQAKIHGVAVRDELLLYVIHGVLHLDGHDDRTDSGYQRMHKKEDEVLTQLGVGAIFASAERRTRISGGR